MKIKKVEEKRMKLHTKDKVKVRMHEPSGNPKLVKAGKTKVAVERKTNRLSDSIKIKNTKLKTLAYTGAKMAADEMEGGEELRESVELMAVGAAPIVGTTNKASNLYRKKKRERRIKREQKDSKVHSEREHTKETSKAQNTGKEKNGKSGKGDTKKGKENKGGSGGSSFVKSRMIESFLEKFRLEEGGDFISSVTKAGKEAAVFLTQRVAMLIAPYALGLFGMVALAGVIVVAILSVIYNSPLAVFFPMPDTGYDHPKTVLSEYYKELNREIITLEEQGNVITYQNMEDGVAVSNYNDTLMVYMVLYGTGQTGLVMDDTGKANLKKVFDEMNYYDTSETTITIPAGASLGELVVTGYCSCSICCGEYANGITASGTQATANRTIAVDAYNPIVPMGTQVVIEGKTYTVEDTGDLNAHGTDIDLYYATHQEALNWGKRTVECFLAEGDENEVEVTTNATVVHNLTYEDVISAGSLSEEQKELLAEMMSDETWDTYYSNAGGQAVADMARTKIGCHYDQDRRMEEGYYDCSSLVYRLYKEIGIELPLIASDQGKYCYENAMLVNKKELQPGDLIFYSYEFNNQFRNISHVAIYVGDGKMVHAANTDRGVVEDDLRTESVVFYARPCQ